MFMRASHNKENSNQYIICKSVLREFAGFRVDSSAYTDVKLGLHMFKTINELSKNRDKLVY